MSGAGCRGRIGAMGHWEYFETDVNILSLDSGGGYTAARVCQHSEICKLGLHQKEWFLLYANLPRYKSKLKKIQKEVRPWAVIQGIQWSRKVNAR